MVDFILSADPRADALRQVADFYVYPQIAIRMGKWAGTRPQQSGKPQHRPQSRLGRPGAVHRPDRADRSHAGGHQQRRRLLHRLPLVQQSRSDIAVWIYAEQENTPFVQALITREPTMQLLYGSSPPDSPGVARHWAHSVAGLNCEYTFTPESGFIPGWQPSRFIEQGENYALALYDALVVGVCVEDIATDGVTLFTDDFDAGTSGLHWNLQTSSSDYTADFGFDYSVHGIPPAPHAAGGTTVGAKFTVNNNDGNPGAEALSAYPGGFAASGDFALRFDMWINYNGGSGGGTGSTEFMVAGCGTRRYAGHLAEQSRGGRCIVRGHR
jgi:hypothetical protein